MSRSFYCVCSNHGYVSVFSPCYAPELHIFSSKKERNAFIDNFITHDDSVNTVAYEIPAKVARSAYMSLVDGVRSFKTGVIIHCSNGSTRRVDNDEA